MNVRTYCLISTFNLRTYVEALCAPFYFMGASLCAWAEHLTLWGPTPGSLCSGWGGRCVPDNWGRRCWDRQCHGGGHGSLRKPQEGARSFSAVSALVQAAVVRRAAGIITPEHSQSHAPPCLHHTFNM